MMDTTHAGLGDPQKPRSDRRRQTAGFGRFGPMAKAQPNQIIPQIQKLQSCAEQQSNHVEASMFSVELKLTDWSVGQSGGSTLQSHVGKFQACAA
jgi:hypothetical protein